MLEPSVLVIHVLLPMKEEGGKTNPYVGCSVVNPRHYRAITEQRSFRFPPSFCLLYPDTAATSTTKSLKVSFIYFHLYSQLKN